MSTMAVHDAQFQQALQLFRRGEYPQAIALLRQIVTTNPGQAEARLNLAKACLDWVQLQTGMPLSEIEVDRLGESPRHFLALAESHLAILARTHGSLLHMQNLQAMIHLIHGRYEEALRCIKKLLSRDRLNPELLYNLGYALMELHRYGEAATQFSRLTALQPAHGMGWHMLGQAKAMLRAPEDAIAAYRRAIELLPEWFQPYGGLASVLRDVGHYEEAKAALREGLRRQPDNWDMNVTLATLALSTGDWLTGWRYYACRTSGAFRPPFPEENGISVQQGQPLRIHYDQGLGDELFFLRFVPSLVAKGWSIHYTAHRKLAPLLQARTDIARLDASESSTPAPHDVLVGDLPYFAGMKSAAEIPPPLTLPLDSAKVERLRSQLQAFGPPPYLGVTWMGGTQPKAGSKGVWRMLFKHIAVASFGKLARDWPGTVVVMQRFPKSGDMESFTKALGRPPLDWSALNDDLTEALAGLSLLDEYVGVSNTNMHLLAGIGKAARVLVPYPPEWRWMAEGDESPWFPGFRIYRQALSGSWDAALARLRQDLSDKYRKELPQ